MKFACVIEIQTKLTYKQRKLWIAFASSMRVARWKQPWRPSSRRIKSTEKSRARHQNQIQLVQNRVTLFLLKTRVRVKILMKHINSKDSSESQLHFQTLCVFRFFLVSKLKTRTLTPNNRPRCRPIRSKIELRRWERYCEGEQLETRNRTGKTKISQALSGI